MMDYKFHTSLTAKPKTGQGKLSIVQYSSGLPHVWADFEACGINEDLTVLFRA